MGEGVTDASGFTTIAVETAHGGLTTPPEFYGFIRVEGMEDFRTQDYLRSDPWLEQYYGSQCMVSYARFESIASRVGLVRDSSLGIVSVHIYDCTGSGATGVSLDFWVRANSDLVLCENCDFAYPSANGYPDASQHQFEFPGSSVALGQALDAVTLVARDTETRQPRGLPRSGYFYADRGQAVSIVPASRREVANMPLAFR